MEESQNDSVVIRETGRAIVVGRTAQQKVRKAMMNIIRDIVYHKDKNIPFNQVQAKKERKTYDKKYKDANLPKLIEQLFAQDKLTKAEVTNLNNALELAKRALSLERSYLDPMRIFISTEPVAPIWIEFLIHIPGIAEVLAATLIAELGNCERYDKVSSLWRHFGLHLVCPKCTKRVEGRDGKMRTVAVVADGLEGKCPECEAQGVAPKRKKGQSIDYNDELRTFAYNIGECLIRKRSPIYYNIYDKERRRQLRRRFAKGKLRELYSDPYKEKDTTLSKGHAISRALRKMVKIFLQHYWEASRELAGLPVRKLYVEEKLGHTGIITWKDVLKANGVEPRDLVA